MRQSDPYNHLNKKLFIQPTKKERNQTLTNAEAQNHGLAGIMIFPCHERYRSIEIS